MQRPKYFLFLCFFYYFTNVGIGNQKTNAGIGIRHLSPVRYRTKKYRIAPLSTHPAIKTAGMPDILSKIQIAWGKNVPYPGSGSATLVPVCSSGSVFYGRYTHACTNSLNRFRFEAIFKIDR
jgi:hypothetical protein